MSSMLVEDPKYSWLKDLGLGTTNKGAFYGVWGGSGEVYINSISTIVYSFVIKPASGSFMLTCASFQLYVYDNR